MKPQEICAYTFSFSETVNLKAQIESAKTFLRIHSNALIRRFYAEVYLSFIVIEFRHLLSDGPESKRMSDG